MKNALVVSLLVVSCMPVMSASSSSDLIEENGGSASWAFSIGGDYPPDLCRVIRDGPNGFIGAGAASLSSTKFHTDAWIARFGFDGSIGWQGQIGGLKDDYFQDISKTMDKGYLLTGGTYSFGSESPAACAWVCRLDSNLNIDWQSRYRISSTTPSFCYCRGFQTSSDELLLLIVDQKGHLIVVCLNGAGKVLSAKLCTFDLPVFSIAPSVLADGSCIVAGTMGSPNFWNKNDSEAIFLRISTNGNIAWAKKMVRDKETTRRGEMFNSAIPTSDGGVAMAGFMGVGTYGQSRLVKINGSGSIQMEKHYQVPGTYCDIHHIGEATDGGFILADVAADVSTLNLVRVSDDGAVKWNKRYVGFGSYAGITLFPNDSTLVWGFNLLARIRSDGLLTKTCAPLNGNCEIVPGRFSEVRKMSVGKREIRVVGYSTNASIVETKAGATRICQ